MRIMEVVFDSIKCPPPSLLRAGSGLHAEVTGKLPVHVNISFPAVPCSLR
eukprot:gene16043-33471_t